MAFTTVPSLSRTISSALTCGALRAHSGDSCDLCLDSVKLDLVRLAQDRRSVLNCEHYERENYGLIFHLLLRGSIGVGSVIK